MNESFNDQEITEFLKYEYALEQEVIAATQEERERERLFATRILAEGLPIASIVEKLNKQPDTSIAGLQIQLGHAIEDFISNHPSVSDENAPFTFHDTTIAKMFIEYGHCKILAQFESAYALYKEVPTYKDLLKEVQFEIITTEQLTAESKIQWNDIAVRFMPSESIDMINPDQDEFVIAKRYEQEYTALTRNKLVSKRQMIYDLLYENGDALGLRNHDDNQLFISKVATSILYENTQFAAFHLQTVYKIGEQMGLTTEEISTMYEWTHAQINRK